MFFPKYDYKESKWYTKEKCNVSITHKLQASRLLQSFLRHVTPFQLIDQYSVSNQLYYLGELVEILWFLLIN